MKERLGEMRDLLANMEVRWAKKMGVSVRQALTDAAAADSLLSSSPPSMQRGRSQLAMGAPSALGRHPSASSLGAMASSASSASSSAAAAAAQPEAYHLVEQQIRQAAPGTIGRHAAAATAQSRLSNALAAGAAVPHSDALTPAQNEMRALEASLRLMPATPEEHARLETMYEDKVRLAKQALQEAMTAAATELYTQVLWRN